MKKPIKRCQVPKTGCSASRFWNLALFLALLSLSGCGTFKKNVAPFERAYLAKQGMQLISNPLEESGKQHMFNAREGSIGGFGGAGGGCGCN